MRNRILGAVAALAVAFGAAGAQANEAVSFILNWVADGDHAPYYYAKKMGWYADAGIDLEIEQGKGSSMASQRVGVGGNAIGLADLGTALVTKGKGADLVAVMNIYAVSPYGLYWLKSAGIHKVQDLAGKKIGNPPWDAARQMWPALAKAADMDPDSVSWVNVQPNAKLSALKSGSIDATTSFYTIHHIFQRELGNDMGFLPWREYGINPYGNSIIVNGEYLKANRDTVAAFVEVTQKAFSACVAKPEPCIDALAEAIPGLKPDHALSVWGLVVELMQDETFRTKGLGMFDPARMKNDYDMVETYFSIETPFDIDASYTNEFLDPAIKMP
jgi:NitT/TauT family transport system substrate-binding protein